MKTYIIEYEGDNSEQKGFCIISESDRRKAIKLFTNEIGSVYDKSIKSINEIKGKSGVIFNKLNVSLS